MKKHSTRERKSSTHATTAHRSHDTARRSERNSASTDEKPPAPSFPTVLYHKQTGQELVVRDPAELKQAGRDYAETPPQPKA